jgi:hypothetical protein
MAGTSSVQTGTGLSVIGRILGSHLRMVRGMASPTGVIVPSSRPASTPDPA